MIPGVITAVHTLQLKTPGAGTMRLYQPTYDPPALG
jgi:hypothetical protein